MKLIIEQTIIVCIYLFSVFLNISNVYFVIENDTTSASCNFPAKFLLIPRNTCTSYFASALCLDCIYMVGRVWSTISHLSDINVVFDKRFRQKESKLKKWIAFEWETTFQTNLYRNDDQPGSILCGNKCVCIYPPPPPNVLLGRLIEQIFQECFKFISLHFSNCCIFLVKTMRKNSEIDSNKSTQYKVKLRHCKWLLLMTENLLRKECHAPASQPGPLVW